MILSPAQIAQLAYNAGFRGDALNQSVAVALAESGGNTDAYNPELAAGTRTGSGSRGLWQIYGTAHPRYNNDSAFDPAINAQAAYEVYREAGNRFTPWSTYNIGVRATQNYAAMVGGKMSQTVKKITGAKTATAVKNSPGSSTRSVQTSGLAGQLQSGVGTGQEVQEKENPILKAFGLIGNVPHPQSLTDWAFVFFGAVFIIVGIGFLLANAATSETGQKVIGTAAKAALI